jgi:hypothetical protein
MRPQAQRQLESFIQSEAGLQTDPVTWRRAQVDEMSGAARYIIYIHRDDFDEMIPQVYDAITI